MIIKHQAEFRQRPWILPKEKTFAPMRERIEWAATTFPCEVELRGIATRSNVTGEFSWSFIRARIDAPGPPLPVSCSYPNARFESEIISVEEFFSRINHCGLAIVGAPAKDTYEYALNDLQIGALSARLGMAEGWCRNSSHGHGRDPRPCWEAHSSLTASSDGLPLISATPNSPFFWDTLDLINTFGGFSHEITSNDHRLRSFNVILIDQRGHLDELVVDGGKLSAKLSGTNLDGLIVQERCNRAKWLHWWTHEARPEIVPGAAEALEAPYKLQLALVTKDDDVVDLQVWDIYPTGSISELRKLLDTGENDVTEFKPWTALAGDKKFHEIERTIVAMANGTALGTLLIGVDDLGRPQWSKEYLDEHMNKAQHEIKQRSSNSSEESYDPLRKRLLGAERYAKHLLKLVNERISPNPVVTATAMEISGEVVLRLQIEPSNLLVEGPNHERLIRRGASNREMSRAELEQVLAREKPTQANVPVD